MTDDIKTSVENHSVKIAMTRRQARIFFEIIDKAMKEQEHICETTSDIEDFAYSNVNATDLVNIRESLYFDAELSDSLEFEAGLNDKKEEDDL